MYVFCGKSSCMIGSPFPLVTVEGSDGVSDQFQTSFRPVSDPQKGHVWNAGMQVCRYVDVGM